MKDFNTRSIKKYRRQLKKESAKNASEKSVYKEGDTLKDNLLGDTFLNDSEFITQEVKDIVISQQTAEIYFESSSENENTLSSINEETKNSSKAKIFARKFISPRTLMVASLIILFIVPIYIFCSTGCFCYLSEAGEKEPRQKVVWTSVNSIRDIVSSVTILDKADRVDVENFGSTYILTVVRSYPVSITVDGTTATVNVLGKTVEELLEEENIELNSEDILSHDLEHVLKEDEVITIKRVTYREREPVKRVIPYGREEKQSPLLRRDSEVVLREGVEGLSDCYYLDRYIDGVFDSETLIEEVIIIPVINERILTGDPLAPASIVDKSKYTDIEIVDGKPSEYLDVMEDAICTAYSFGPNTFGASGMKMIQGFVATNPEVIPYGTLLYIASDRFTYGWAIAADCGTAMMEGYVDIDCYFETYDESVIFGKKLLNVYIIMQLTQNQLEEYVANRMFYSRVPKTLELS